MTNKQAFIIGICIIIGLVIHGFIIQEKYQLTDSNGYLTKINTQTGEAFALHEGNKIWEFKDLEWIALPIKKEEKQGDEEP